MIENSFDKRGSTMSGRTSTITTTRGSSRKAILRPFRRWLEQFIIRFVIVLLVCARISRGVIWRDSERRRGTIGIRLESPLFACLCTILASPYISHIKNYNLSIYVSCIVGFRGMMMVIVAGTKDLSTVSTTDICHQPRWILL
jgi:hypothetical protein